MISEECVSVYNNDFMPDHLSHLVLGNNYMKEVAETVIIAEHGYVCDAADAIIIKGNKNRDDRVEYNLGLIVDTNNKKLAINRDLMLKTDLEVGDAVVVCYMADEDGFLYTYGLINSSKDKSFIFSDRAVKKAIGLGVTTSVIAALSGNKDFDKIYSEGSKLFERAKEEISHTLTTSPSIEEVINQRLKSKISNKSDVIDLEALHRSFKAVGDGPIVGAFKKLSTSFSSNLIHGVLVKYSRKVIRVNTVEESHSETSYHYEDSVKLSSLSGRSDLTAEGKLKRDSLRRKADHLGSVYQESTWTQNRVSGIEYSHTFYVIDTDGVLHELVLLSDIESEFMKSFNIGDQIAVSVSKFDSCVNRTLLSNKNSNKELCDTVFGIEKGLVIESKLCKGNFNHADCLKFFRECFSFNISDKFLSVLSMIASMILSVAIAVPLSLLGIIPDSDDFEGGLALFAVFVVSYVFMHFFFSRIKKEKYSNYAKVLDVISDSIQLRNSEVQRKVG